MKTNNLILRLAGIFVLFIAVSSCNLTDEPNLPDVNTAEDEQQIIDNWIYAQEDSGLDVDTTELGVYYAIKQIYNGETSYPQDGDSIGIEYMAYFTDGLIFDDSSYHYNDNLYRYVHSYDKVESGELIPGFYDAVSHLKEKYTADFLIPSGLSWGHEGNDIVPPYTPVIFQIRLDEIYQ